MSFWQMAYSLLWRSTTGIFLRHWKMNTADSSALLSCKFNIESFEHSSDWYDDVLQKHFLFLTPSDTYLVCAAEMISWILRTSVSRNSETEWNTGSPWMSRTCSLAPAMTPASLPPGGALPGFPPPGVLVGTQPRSLTLLRTTCSFAMLQQWNCTGKSTRNLSRERLV